MPAAKYPNALAAVNQKRLPTFAGDTEEALEGGLLIRFVSWKYPYQSKLQGRDVFRWLATDTAGMVNVDHADPAQQRKRRKQKQDSDEARLDRLGHATSKSRTARQSLEDGPCPPVRLGSRDAGSSTTGTSRPLGPGIRRPKASRAARA